MLKRSAISQMLAISIVVGTRDYIYVVFCINGVFTKAKRALLKDKALFALVNKLWNRIIKTAESIADFRSKQTDHSDYDDGDEREDDRVLDEALAQFFGCK